MKWSRARRGAEEGEHECKGRGVLLQLLEVLGMLQAGDLEPTCCYCCYAASATATAAVLSAADG